ncbi:MAG: HPP family protein [Burkholderiales bacterium]
MKGIFLKLRGGQLSPLPVPPLFHVALTWLGGFVAIAAVALMADVNRMPLVLGSFGASCVLIFGYPESPFSQPRNVIGGHFLASLTGLAFFALFGFHWWSMALALASAIAVMQLTKTVHPPAGSNPLIIMLSGASWPFLLTPTLYGSVILLAVALIFHGLVKGRVYPKYWV